MNIAQVCRRLVTIKCSSKMCRFTQRDATDVAIFEHVWDTLDQRIRQRVPDPANIQRLGTAIEEEWTNISQSPDQLYMKEMFCIV